MDATRPRRTRDDIRRRWYSLWRSIRFARFLGFDAHPAKRGRDMRGAMPPPSVAA